MAEQDVTDGEVLRLADLRDACARHEATLRMQYPPDGRLPAEDEAELARCGPATARGVLQRYALLKYLFRRRQEAGGPGRPGIEQAETAMRQLLRREPIVLELGAHRVHVTARSYAALYEIAAHATRSRELAADLVRIDSLHARTVQALVHAPRAERGRLRARLRRLGQLHRRTVLELGLHRRAIYAHALTPSGAPAESLVEAPRWVDEIDAIWDGVLLAAIHEVGAGRYSRLGEPPERPGKAPPEPLEDFGWHTHFALIERNRRMPEASLYDRDLYRELAWLRASADAPPLLPGED